MLVYASSQYPPARDPGEEGAICFRKHLVHTREAGSVFGIPPDAQRDGTKQAQKEKMPADTKAERPSGNEHAYETLSISVYRQGEISPEESLQGAIRARAKHIEPETGSIGHLSGFSSHLELVINGASEQVLEHADSNAYEDW